MTTDRIAPDESGAFSVTANKNRDFVELTFSHVGGTAHDVRIYYGEIQDGVAVAGDGERLGDLQRDVLATIFIRGEVDALTIVGDYSNGVSGDITGAIFVTWRTAKDSSGICAVGIKFSHIKQVGFGARAILESGDAINYMVDTGMTLEGEFRAASTSKPEGVYFTQLSIAGYRGFAQERTLRLAQPNGESGSGLTVIVGANNSGKSTFLEAIQVIARARNQIELSFSQPRRHRDADAVSIELVRSDNRRLKVESIKSGGSQATATWEPGNVGPDRFDIQVTPSRRQFSPYFGSTGPADRNWGLMDQEFSRTQLRENFVGRLRKVDRDADARKVFDRLLEEIVGAPFVWTIDEIAPGQQFLKLIESDGAWHTSEGLGDGLISLLFIVDALYDSAPGSLIAIDEPELSLHPQLVRRLSLVLARFASDRQIVVATHSPLLVDWAHVSNGASIARVYKVDGRSEISQASDGILQTVAKLADSRNLRNPHTVGAIAREAFFLEDGIILTEGQDDVAYLPRILEDLGLPNTDNVYGWGSGGVGNIPVIAQLFVELGFTRIGAILDDDNQPGTQAAVAKLESMAPRVLVRQIPAPDIRYKSKTASRSEVIGLLDKDNTHVRDELRETAAKVLKDVIDHVSSPLA